MTTIKLELSEENPTVLYHFGEALRNIAISDGFIAPSNTRKTTISETVGNMNKTVIDEPVVTQDKRDELVKQFENPVLLSDDHIEPLDPSVAEATVLPDVIVCTEITGTIDEPDTDLPWDKRIHSRGKTQLADGTWRYARKPNDKTKEEWDLYVEEVETELKALMAIPVATDTGPFYWCHSESDECGVVDTREQLDEYVLSSPLCHEITKSEYDHYIRVDSLPTPEIVTPEIVTPEIVTPEIVATGPQNFGELMRFITANGKKLNNDIVKEVLAANGLASIALLAARVDLIPQIHQALLGRL